MTTTAASASSSHHLSPAFPGRAPWGTATEFVDGITLPMAPFLGVMAAEPPGDDPVSAILTGPNGGNLVLRELPLTDDALKHLRGLRGLTDLDLTGTQITDAGLKELARLPNLEALALHETAISAGGLSALARHPRAPTWRSSRR